ncbi:CRISPR-associated helicase Cas3' [Spirosoma soli]|uniref:CRISPR-associated helicase Cas3 n=1 Tax=Spirosoma soli TaxID=1770529 RepID=A0ABW5LYY5_9BACT
MMLAKSDPPLSLEQHVADCLLIRDWLMQGFPQLNRLTGVTIDLWEALRIAIIFHDLGKTHREFQNVLGDKPNNWLRQRHELFSLPFLDAYSSISSDVHALIRLAVAGHHKSYNDLQDKYIRPVYQGLPAWGYEPDEDDLLNFADEFKKVNTAWVKDYLSGLFGVQLGPLVAKQPGELINAYVQKLAYVASHPDYLNLLLLFGALKHCDHMGSARIDNVPFLLPTDFDFLQQKELDLQQKGLNFYQHQKESEGTVGNVILTSPTGSGKTESALLWVQRQMQENGSGRVFYILPFTASINAMFERLNDKKGGIPDQKAGMVHGKLAAYLNQYLDEAQYVKSQKKEALKSIAEKFRTLQTPLKVVTPFQLLKHLYGLKGFEQGIFEWVGSYFIFDEIHAYQPDVVAQIKVLLEFVTQRLNGKVFIMTATMPTFLQNELQASVGSFMPITAADDVYQQFVRHRVVVESGLLADNLIMIRQRLDKGQKVLVVCNTVRQAQAVYKTLKPSAKGAILLHSAFNGRDRSKHEKDLLKAEQGNADSVQLLIGTQAIEVSLDIDFDVLFSEPAPVDALLQRFGRVNRKRAKGVCEVIIFDQANPTDKFIYDTQVVNDTVNVLKKIANQHDGIIQENELGKWIDAVYPDWNQRQRNDFEDTYRLFKANVNELIPLLHSRDNEEAFYKKFDGVKVLPTVLWEEYKAHLASFDFIEAEALQVQIRKQKFVQLMREGSLRKEVHVLETKKKLLNLPYYLINRGYSSELGLDYDEQEEWPETDNLL